MRWVSFDEIIEPLGDLYDKAAAKDDAFSAGECSGIWNAMQMIGKFADEAELIRHGKWTQICDTRDWQYTNEHYRCSECLETSAYKSNYCPNCGAKMKDGI